jgi:hypothetical protein
VLSSPPQFALGLPVDFVQEARMAAQAVQLNGTAPLEPSGSVLPPLYLPRPRGEYWFKYRGRF